MKANHLRQMAQTGAYPINEPILVEMVEDETGNPGVCGFFEDVEGDLIRIDFHNDGSMHVDTSSYPNIVADQGMLETILSAASDAEEMNEELDAFLDSKTGEWSGYKHLLTRPSLDA